MKKEINWTNTLFLTLTPLLAVVFTTLHFIYEGANWHFLYLFAIFYVITGISITGGYHRLFAHRAYKAHPVVKFFYLVFGAACFENSALKWSEDHRAHHTFVDTDKDPYNAKEGFLWSHMLWIMCDQGNNASFPVNDLKNDKLVMWQFRNYIKIGILAGFVLPTIVGALYGAPLGGLGILALARIVAVHHSTFFINSLCHIWGKDTFSAEHTAKDNFLISFLTFGEGYHNFHHTYQHDYRNGVRAYDFDPTKWLILTLKGMGLAHGLRKVGDDKIVKRRLEMDQIRLMNRPNYTEKFQRKVQELKDQLESAASALQVKKDEYRALKEEYKKNYDEWTDSLSLQAKEKMDELKQAIQEAKLEFQEANRNWRMLQASI